jgi:hypothetical protein
MCVRLFHLLFYSLKFHFTFKIPSFHMEFFTNHMSTYIYKVVKLPLFKHKHRVHIEYHILLNVTL